MGIAMGRYDDCIERLARTACSAEQARSVIALLAEAGLLNESRCRGVALGEYVDRLVRSGRPKTEAIEQAAEDFGCSYQTACRDVYDKLNIRTIQKLKR